jgi:hypothetical protein
LQSAQASMPSTTAVPPDMSRGDVVELSAEAAQKMNELSNGDGGSV